MLPGGSYQRRTTLSGKCHEMLYEIKVVLIKYQGKQFAKAIKEFGLK